MPTTSRFDRVTEQELLDQTQACLEYRSLGHDPPPSLAAAWDRFYEVYAPRLRAELARWYLTTAEREDCLQEVWMSIIAHLRGFRRDQCRGCLSTWLTTVARNKAMDTLRRRRRRAECLIGGGEDALPDTSPDPATEWRGMRCRIRSDS